MAAETMNTISILSIYEDATDFHAHLEMARLYKNCLQVDPYKSPELESNFWGFMSLFDTEGTDSFISEVAELNRFELALISMGFSSFHHSDLRKHFRAEYFRAVINQNSIGDILREKMNWIDQQKGLPKLFCRVWSKTSDGNIDYGYPAEISDQRSLSTASNGHELTISPGRLSRTQYDVLATQLTEDPSQLIIERAEDEGRLVDGIPEAKKKAFRDVGVLLCSGTEVAQIIRNSGTYISFQLMSNGQYMSRIIGGGGGFFIVLPPQSLGIDANEGPGQLNLLSDRVQEMFQTPQLLMIHLHQFGGFLNGSNDCKLIWVQEPDLLGFAKKNAKWGAELWTCFKVWSSYAECFRSEMQDKPIRGEESYRWEA
ncbi:hypothetical protein F5X96DRAFT_683948 [Biscogniauxia mediterranea]|nr:hypothetical protein F5X96DRAFT_683948 [Biscogniauxia mediterranea]